MIVQINFKWHFFLSICLMIRDLSQYYDENLISIFQWNNSEVPEYQKPQGKACYQKLISTKDSTSENHIKANVKKSNKIMIPELSRKRKYSQNHETTLHKKYSDIRNIFETQSMLTTKSNQ